MLKEIKTIYLPRLKNPAHAEFHENIKITVEKTGAEALGISESYDLYIQAFNNELECLNIITKSDITKQINEQDDVRDSIFRGLSDAIKSYRNHFMPEYRIAANKLWSVMLHFGNLAPLSLDQQTALVSDIMREFKKTELAEAITFLNLDVWCNELEFENNKLRDLMTARYNEAVDKTPYRMKTARLVTDKYYRLIVSHLEYKIAINDKPAGFDEFIIELNAIIKRYKDILAQDFGRKNKIETTEQAPNEQNHQHQHQPHWTPVPPRDNDKPFEK